MKPALNPRQVSIWGGGLLLLLVALALAWFGLSGLSEKQAEAQALAERMGNPALGSLLADSAGMATVARDVAEIQKLEEELQKSIGPVPARWAASTRLAYAENEAWASDPGKWKDELIAVVSRLQKVASEAHVRLAQDFYLGLDAFRQKSPAPSEVPALALHLSVSQRLVEKLIEARKAREQYVTTCEIKLLEGPGSFSEKPPDGESKARSMQPGTGSERKMFRLEVLCSPEVLYEYVRLLSTDDWLFLLKDLVVTNQKLDFPSRSEIAKKFSLGATNAPEGEQPKKPSANKLLEILAGDEALVCRLEIEFVPWKLSEPATPQKAGKAP